jgi:aryl-alcohol dehydrogenase-like predicted oxidoreductase
LEYRQLGNTDLRPSVIGFGCNRIGRHWRGEAHGEVAATIESAFEQGINFYDTADNYCVGDSERFLGEVFHHRRDKVILCSKVGHKLWASLPFDRWMGWLGRASRRYRVLEDVPFIRSSGLRWNYLPRFVEMALEGSLRRLRADYLDVFYLHNPPPEVVRNGAALEALEKLKQKGLIRHYGVSCGWRCPTDRALEWLERPGVSVLQMLTNAMDTVDVRRLRGPARERGVGLVGRQPFDKRAVLADARLQRMFAGREDRSFAQAALRFALQQDGVSVVLVGMRSRAHLDENVAALTAPPLSGDEMELLLSGAKIR